MAEILSAEADLSSVAGGDAVLFMSRKNPVTFSKGSVQASDRRVTSRVQSGNSTGGASESLDRACERLSYRQVLLESFNHLNRLTRFD
jgi:hypothetical protein